MKDLKLRHSELIETFFKVAERKVSTLDEYGDENWAALPVEIERCIQKAMSRDGLENMPAPPRSPSLSYRLGLEKFQLRPKEWVQLGEYLEAEFRRRHAQNSSDRVHFDRDIESMDGVEFESFVASVLKRVGFKSVRGTPATGDQGADLIGEHEGKTVVIQAKRYSRPVGNAAVQEVIAALVFYRGDEGWVVTNSTFTSSAISLARSANVRLVDGVELQRLRRG